MPTGESNLLTGQEIIEWASARDLETSLTLLGNEEAELAIAAVSDGRVQKVKNALSTELNRRVGEVMDEKMDVQRRLEGIKAELGELASLRSIVTGDKLDRSPEAITSLSNLPRAVLILERLNTFEEKKEREDKLKKEVMLRAPSIDNKLMASRVANIILHRGQLPRDYFECSEEQIVFRGTGTEEPNIKQVFAYTRLVGEKVGRGIFEVFGSLGKEQAEQQATWKD